jgi:adenosylhomocysteine nucleosidase
VRGPLIAVVGMVSEARIVAFKGVTVLIGGGRSEQLAARLDQALARDIAGVISFGLCGALDPDLSVGELLVASSVDGTRADPTWAQQLLDALPGARLAPLTGGDRIVPDVEAKAELRRRTGAAAVDMESHIVARLAGRQGVPFAVLRAVSDDAERVLPSAARLGLAPDGNPDIAAVLRSLWRDPRQLASLIAVARDAATAMRSLRRAAPTLTAGLPS